VTLNLSTLLRRVSHFEPSDARRAIAELEGNVGQMLDALGSRARILTATEQQVSLTAGGSTVVSHGLTIIPNRFAVVYLDADLNVYASGTWTDRTATLSAAGTGSSVAQVLFWRAI